MHWTGGSRNLQVDHDAAPLSSITSLRLGETPAKLPNNDAVLFAPLLKLRTFTVNTAFGMDQALEYFMAAEEETLGYLIMEEEKEAIGCLVELYKDKLSSFIFSLSLLPRTSVKAMR